MKKIFALIAVILIFAIQIASAATFTISDFTESELRDIRRQIHVHLSENKRGDILYEDKNVTIIYLGWKKIYSSYEFWVTFVNNTDKKLMVVSENTSVNDAACSASSVFEVPAGKRTNDDIFAVYESVLEEQWIDEIEYVEFSIHYYDSDDFQGLDVETPNPFKIEFIEPAL